MNSSNNNNSNTSRDDSITPPICFNLPYTGDKGEHITKSCIRKLRSCTTEKIKFRVRYNTTKLCYFTNTKDPTPILNKSNVVYEFSCPGCRSKYIGKTDRTLYERTLEHSHKKDSAIFCHLENCNNFQHILDLFSIHDVDKFDERQFYKNIVQNNTSVISSDNNWNLLLYKEAFFIKQNKPSLNTGLRASRELTLFN